MDDQGRVEFSREIPKSDSREIWADGAKWNDFFTTLLKAKDEGATTLVIATPEVLGDTWREMVVTLSAIASAGLTLEIRHGGDVVTQEVEFTKDGERDRVTGVAIERKAPMLSNPELQPREVTKHGPFILRHGNKPAVELLSSGPDPVYCQAELLMKRDWEEFKATARNREILGFYEITAGTIEWFLHQHKDKPTQGVLEEYRRKILAKGWDFYHIPIEDRERVGEAKRALKSTLKEDTLLKGDKKYLRGLQKRLDDVGKS